MLTETYVSFLAAQECTFAQRRLCNTTLAVFTAGIIIFLLIVQQSDSTKLRESTSVNDLCLRYVRLNCNILTQSAEPHSNHEGESVFECTSTECKKWQQLNAAGADIRPVGNIGVLLEMFLYSSQLKHDTAQTTFDKMSSHTEEDILLLVCIV